MTQSAHNTRLEITESMRHTQPHHHISTQILGITAALGTHTHTLSYGHLTAGSCSKHILHLRHNTPASISSHLFPSRASQWAFMEHFHICTSATFVQRRVRSGRVNEEERIFFFFLHCLGVFNGHNSEDSKHLPRWFVYYVNQLVIRGVEGVITFYSQTSLMY